MFIREMSFGAPDAKSRAVPLTLSTETPVDRGDYIEVLSHTPGDIDLCRSPLPLITSHDQRGLPVGVVTDLRIEGRKLKGIAVFGNSTRAQEVFQDVQDGILRAVSIGYEYTDQGKAEGSGSDIIRFKFRPLEVSAVSVPADPNAGFFRSYSMEHQINQEQGENTLSRSQRRAANVTAESRRQIEADERARVAEIAAMCRHHDCSQLGEEMIADGTSLTNARAAVLEHLSRSRPMQRSLSSPTHDRDDYLDMGNEARQFSIVRAINAMVSGDWSKAGLERAASQAVARQVGRSPEGFFVPFDTQQVRSAYAVGTAGAGTTGGTLVGTELLAEAFINVLRARSRVIEAGAMLLPGLVGNVDIPRQTSASQTGWITEGASLSESEGTFDKLSLSPKTIGTYSQISRNMLLQSTPAIELMVRGDLAAQLALGIDNAAINGAGGAAPTGILNAAGLGSVVGGTNGAQLTFDHLIDLATAVANANADFGSLAYMINPKAVGWLSKQKASTGQYLWPNRGGNALMNSAPATAVPGATPFGNIGDFGALGYPLAVTNQVPGNLTKGTANGICSAVIFGNWNDLIIGEWGTLEIVVNPYDTNAYKAGAVLIRAMQSIDIGVRHAASFAVMTDALTA